MESDPLARVEELERDVARISSELAALKADVGGAPVPRQASAPAAWAPPSPARSTWPTPTLTPIASVTSRRRPDVTMDSETVLKWGGVGLVVLAVGFAVSTAISRNWIGPELQLAGALLVGFGLIGAGLRVRENRPAWTHALCSGGVLALFTTFASDLFLDRANDVVAFAATAVIAAGALFLARTIRSEWVAAAALFGGAIGWAVIGDGDAPVGAYVAWYVLLVAAVIAISLERRWMAIRPAAHVVGMIATLGTSGLADTSSDQTLVGVATVVFAIGLVVVPSIGDLSSLWQQFEVQVAAAAAPWAFFVTMISTLEERSDRVIAIVALAIAAAAAGTALGLRQRLRHAHVVSLLLGASVTTSIGLSILLSTSAAFVALAIQAAGLVVMSRALDRNVRVLINAAVLAAISLVYVLIRMIDAWEDDVRVGHDIAHAVILVAIGVGVHQTGQRLVQRAGAAGLLALALIWLGSVLVHLPQGQAVVSVSWAVVGTAVFLAGVMTKRADAATAGLAVIGLTVGKLLTVDLREVDTLWRAGLFFVVGLGLMRLGFLLPRLTSDDDSDHDSDDDDDDVALGGGVSDIADPVSTA